MFGRHVFLMVDMLLNSVIQLELHARLDFLWRLQAKQELQEMDSVRENNLTLLRNILPEHVANNFLARNRKDEVTQHLDKQPATVIVIVVNCY